MNIKITRIKIPAPENMLNIFKKPKLPTDHNEKGN